MDRFSPFEDPAALDEALLDVATLIELSPRDRQVAENRFRILKMHLERGASAIALYLIDGESCIYAQGSIATSTTIVDGTGEDRFDVDAIVEIDVPADKNEHWALNILEESLQDFPGVTEIVRCTRCVQLRFPFMHMDVTVMDRTRKLAIERAGEIFHSPDEGPSKRVPSNPWGFTKWFRGKVGIGRTEFTEALKRHRAFGSRNRLTLLAEDREVLAKATQHPLPPAIPSALDAQEAVALKLLKRYLNVRYAGRSIKRPPSIYLTKRTGDVGFVNMGLTVQLLRLANSTAQIMRTHLANGTRPAEVNPSYHLDVINDRWPRAGKDGVVDMTTLAESLEHLADRLQHMASAELSEVAKIIDELFGERIGRESRTLLAERYDRREAHGPVLSAVRSGAIASPAILHATAGAKEVPRHNFHASEINGSQMAVGKSNRSSHAQVIAMEARWPDFVCVKQGNGALVWRGPLRPKIKTYTVQVYWHAATFALPYVCVINPKLKPRPGVGFDAIPHLIFDAAEPERSGLCLFDPAAREWDPSKLIADTTIYWAAEWLLYYELWHLTGKWLGPSVGPESIAAMQQSNTQEYKEANGDVH